MANRVQVSLPSKKISTVDVAEIEQFKTSFVYNFFQKDERSNETGESMTITITVISIVKKIKNLWPFMPWQVLTIVYTPIG